MLFKIEPTLTKQFLLDRASQETYLEYYLGIPVKKGLFRSPLRVDNKPTCSFYRSKNGDIIFKDFNGSFSGNFIDVVKYKYNVSYYKALKIIANDFNYVDYKNLEKNTKPIKYVEKEFKDTKGAKIQVEIQEFNSVDLEYWKQFGIDISILKKFKVFSCKTVFLNNRYFDSYSYTKPIYGYYRGKNSENLELWRIYFPKAKHSGLRFLSNWKSILLQGSQQLPKNGDTLIITKSLKDVMCLYSLGYTAIAPVSENLFLTEAQYNKLKSRFNNIILFYDNDLPGISNMNKIRKKFNVQCMWIPRKYKAKDISDFYKMYGREESLNLIEYAKTKLRKISTKS